MLARFFCPAGFQLKIMIEKVEKNNVLERIDRSELKTGKGCGSRPTTVVVLSMGEHSESFSRRASGVFEIRLIVPRECEIYRTAESHGTEINGPIWCCAPPTRSTPKASHKASTAP